MEKTDIDQATYAGQTNTLRVSRNFRSLPDIENFYRFIYENDLRAQAFLILEKVHAYMQKNTKKPKRPSKAKPPKTLIN